jgi:hypothetical protein
MRLAAGEIRLDHDADVPLVARFGMDAAHHVDGRLRILAALHIHAHEASCLARMLCHLPDNALRQLRIQVHTHLRQLHAHIRVQVPLVNRVQQFVINGRGAKRLIG